MVFYNNGQYIWEPGPNRTLALSSLMSSEHDVLLGGAALLTLYWGGTASTPGVPVPREAAREGEVLEGQVVGEGDGGDGQTMYEVVVEAAGGGAAPPPVVDDAGVGEEQALNRFLTLMMAMMGMENAGGGAHGADMEVEVEGGGGRPGAYPVQKP